MLKKIQKVVGLKMLQRYKLRSQKISNTSLNHCFDSIRKMLKKSKYCFLISNSNRPWPSARMVQPIIDFDSFEIWLGTNPSLRKVKEIEVNPHVTLAFGDEKENANLIVHGSAELIRTNDERKKHWIFSWLLFFPEGPKGDDFISIRIVPAEIELMNFKRNVVYAEPYGLKPVKIIKEDNNWKIQ